MPLAIVTGASRGLGRAVAVALAEGGEYRVCAVCRDAASAAETVDALKDASPRTSAAAHRATVVDLGDAQAAAEPPATLAARVAGGDEPVALLVNNAGVYLDEWTPAAFATSRRVNLLAPLALIAATRFASNARVVNVSSGYGQLAGLSPTYRRDVDAARTFDELRAIDFRADDPMGNEFVAPYKVTKAMLNKATRIAAADLAPRGIRVNSVCPGWVRTRMGGPAADRSVDEGAASILWATTTDQTGGFFRDGAPLRW